MIYWMMGAQQKLTSSYGINDHIHVHTIVRSHRYMVHTRAQWTSSRSHVSIFFLLFSSFSAVHQEVLSTSEPTPTPLSQNSQFYNQVHVDVGREDAPTSTVEEDATTLLDRDAVNVVKDGVHCIVYNAQSMYMDVTVTPPAGGYFLC